MESQKLKSRPLFDWNCNFDRKRNVFVFGEYSRQIANAFDWTCVTSQTLLLLPKQSKRVKAAAQETGNNLALKYTPK